LWEPLYGTRHFQFGAGLSGEAALWEEDDSKFKVSFDAQYRYGFEREVKRLVGLKGLTPDTSNYWGHYNLIQINTAAADAQLIPAANILAMDLKVTPGSMIDAFVMASLCAKACAIDVGYNLYATRAQTPLVKDWTTVYNRVDRTYTTASTFAANTTAQQGTQITKDKLDKDIDGQIIHRIFGSIGAVPADWEYPVTFGLGGSIEFVQGGKKQVTPQNWEIFGKVGISF